MYSKFVQIESEDLMMIEGGGPLGKLSNLLSVFDFFYNFGKWLGRKSTVTVY